MKTKKQSALLAAIKAGKLESKSQCDLIFKILNHTGNDELKAEINSLFQSDDFEGVQLSDEQNTQAHTWLKNLWLTPTGAERKNNPFGYREQAAIEKFSHCELKGCYDAGRWLHHYIPLYYVITKDGYGFEYYYYGEISITG